jgi:hypothetical protein
MSKYAQNTSVSSDKSKAEIEKTLTRYGANGFMYGWSEQNAVIAFEMVGRRIKFVLPMPNRNEFLLTDTGRERAESQVQIAYEQATRQRWRALALVIKAKLEAVETGITEFQEEFMAHIVLPNGSKVGQYMLPQIDKSYENNSMPPLLPHLTN